MDSEKVINSFLENSLPLELTVDNSDDLLTPSQYNNDIYEENASGYDPSYKGY